VNDSLTNDSPKNPPEPSDSQLASLRLSQVSGIGPRLYRDLIEHFGTAERVLAAPPNQLQEVPGVGPKLARAIVMADSEVKIEELLKLCRDENIELLFCDDPTYPRLLTEIHDPPVVLFIKGSLLPADQLSIAIVGSRHATQYGLKVAEQLAHGLSMVGLTIVSGLARGIDQAAHRAAITAGGRTLAVLGSGVLDVYPPENLNLSRQVAESGALISEFHPLAPPRGSYFPQRNRIVSGLSLGTIVVEAADRSGALISARLAMEQGREVFAVPGRIDCRMSHGTNRLIRDGAKLIQSVDDVLEELGPLVAPVQKNQETRVHHPAELKLNERETAVLQAISVEPTSIDEIVAKTQIQVHHVLATLSALEIRRLIRRLSGSSVVRV
jgi:DNA processing protein